MHFAARKNSANLRGLIIESSHLGLSEEAKKARLAQDRAWARRFSTEEFDKTLTAWYEQEIFSSLSKQQKNVLIDSRLKNRLKNQTEQNYCEGLAEALLATSLAKQPCFTQKNFAMPLLYLCGEKDKKFAAIATASSLEYKKVKKAGHNIHFEQACLYSNIIANWIEKQEKNYG